MNFERMMMGRMFVEMGPEGESEKSPEMKPLERNLVVLANDYGVKGYCAGIHETPSMDILIIDDIERIDELVDPHIPRLAELYVYLSEGHEKDLCEFLAVQRILNQNLKAALVGCQCDYLIKVGISEAAGLPLITSECDGKQTMGSIANAIYRREMRYEQILEVFQAIIPKSAR